MESSAAGAHLRGAAASILAPLRNPSIPVLSRRLAPNCRAKVRETAAPERLGELATPPAPPQGPGCAPTAGRPCQPHCPSWHAAGRADAWQRPAADEARAGLISM